MANLAKVVLDSKRIKSPGFATTLKQNIEGIVARRGSGPTVVRVLSRNGAIELGYDPRIVLRHDIALAATRVGYKGSYEFH